MNTVMNFWVFGFTELGGSCFYDVCCHGSLRVM
jgi:hypothetical protein